MKTAKAVFQQVMGQILQSLQSQYFAFYTNVIELYNPSLKKHQSDLEDVFIC